MKAKLIQKHVSTLNPDWRTRLLYRYLDKRWIELFRNEGTFRIHTIAKYRATGDVREDDTEGIETSIIQGTGYLTGEQAKHALGVDVHSITFEPGWKGSIRHNLHLPNGYMVCTSATLGSHLLKHFGVDDYFTITNVDIFEDSLARAISDYVKIKLKASDKVTYLKQKEHSLTVAQVTQLDTTMQQPKLESYFKKTRSYAVEAEYRFVFLTDTQNALQYLDLQLTQTEIKSCCRFNENVSRYIRKR